MKFGFSGVGNMGNPMALNLVKAGHSLLVHDIRHEVAANLEEAGATWVNSPKEAATGVEATFLSLPMPADVERVVLAESGVLAGMRSGGVIIDMSKNLATAVGRLAEDNKAKGVTLFHGPRARGVSGAGKVPSATIG